MSADKQEIIIELLNREMSVIVSPEEFDDTLAVVNRLQEMASEFTSKYEIDDEAYLALMIALTIGKTAHENELKLQMAEQYIEQIEAQLSGAINAE